MSIRKALVHATDRTAIGRASASSHSRRRAARTNSSIERARRLAATCARRSPRRTAGARHAEPVLERAVHQTLAEPVQQPSVQRYFLPVEDFLTPAPRQGDEVVEQLTLQAPRILHTHHREGNEVFVDARRREGIGRSDFAPVFAHRFRTLRTVDAEPGSEGLGIGEHVIADPGERKISHDLFVGAKTVEPIAVDRRDNEIVERQHDALRASRGAGGVEHDGKIRPAARSDGRLSAAGQPEAAMG